jgi:hypothetical protein
LALAGIIAVTVAFASTLAGSVLDHVHQVDAEGLVAGEAQAAASDNGMQRLAIKEWGVQLTMPLADALPVVSYAEQSKSSVGLSAEDVSQLGPECRASRGALGTLVRLPGGTFGQTKRGATIEYFVATVGGYDYAYQLPQGSCTDLTGAQPLVNREVAVIREALGTLAPLGAQ